MFGAVQLIGFFDKMQIESKFILSTKLSVEGPCRMKEEYVEGIFESPTIIEETIPEQLRGALGQAMNTVQQLPLPIRDALSSGLKIPLSKPFNAVFSRRIASVNCKESSIKSI